MKIATRETTDEALHIDCEGEVTQRAFRAGDDPLQVLLSARGYASHVLLSLEKTTYIDSSGISWLLISHKRFLEAGGKLVLYGLPPLVEQVLRLMKMELVLNLATDKAGALATLRGEKS